LLDHWVQTCYKVSIVKKVVPQQNIYFRLISLWEILDRAFFTDKEITLQIIRPIECYYLSPLVWKEVLVLCSSLLWLTDGFLCVYLTTSFTVICIKSQAHKVTYSRWIKASLQDFEGLAKSSSTVSCLKFNQSPSSFRQSIKPIFKYNQLGKKPLERSKQFHR